MIKLQPEERKAFTRYIYSVSSIALDDSKGYLIEGRLGGLAEEIGCGSFQELLLRAQSDTAGTVRHRVIDAITTNETSFFRDTSPFELLRFKLVPEILDRLSRSGRPRSIRIWSAASSTGQEIYSIAITLKEMLGDPERYGVHLMGTDISNRAVARASRGIFNPIEVARGLSDALRAKYFTKVEDGWKIRDEIRAMACFRTLNLMQDFSVLGRFDIVFCRNVAIYFSEADRISLFGRIGKAMERDGSLIVGSMETLDAICPQFVSQRHLRSVYYKLNE